ncbi:PAS domain S-box protein [Halonotius terrestris]|uniref:PAS domain S-box protein n=1 Tax=Halonotius terrestris TaxID=2487750 RepID=A0A8J8TD46_9EURY|nr:PAS domain-containing protein [Halonotius terrestris]TQQ82834.1 PAS domain S-box protein [Halonotius terrestris]
MSATQPTDGDRTLQLIVASDGDREALQTILSEQYEVVIDDDLQPADCYLIGDNRLPEYEDDLRELKTETYPTFQPVLLLQRADNNGRAFLPTEPGSEPPLVDEVVTAPIDRATLYRRLQNLLIRREQSEELAARYENIQRQFERLFEATNDAILVIDPDSGTIEECNPAAAELTGRSRSALVGIAPDEILAGEGTRSLAEFVASVVANGQGWTDEFTCQADADDQRQVEISAATFEAEAGPSVLFSIRDVTERKAYERELELKTEAIDGAPTGITISDPNQEDNPLVYTNDGFTAITGYDESTIIGQNCRFLQGPKTREEPVAEMREAIANEEQVTVELKNYRQDGSEFWNRVTIAPVWNDDGELQNFIGFQEDVTDRKERERDLQLFRKAVENSGNSVIITDRNGNVEYVNAAFEAQTGYTREEILDNNPNLLSSGKQSDAFYDDLWETILAGETWEAELVNQRKSGGLYRVEQEISPITNSVGEITHFVAIERDVTNRRLREQQLDVLNRILRHNLRNGMNVIEGNVSLLEERVDDEAADQFFDAINTRINDLDRLSARAATVRSLFANTDSEEVVSDIPLLFTGLEEKFASRYPSASLTTESASLAVKADNRLELGLLELIDNFIQHNDQPTPTVTVTATPHTEMGAAEWVEIVVTDNGPGIPMYEWQAIQAGEETPLEHGTGLGLWLVHWTVSLLGGEVRIEEDDTGTKAVLTLPRADGNGKSTDNAADTEPSADSPD